MDMDSVKPYNRGAYGEVGNTNRIQAMMLSAAGMSACMAPKSLKDRLTSIVGA